MKIYPVHKSHYYYFLIQILFFYFIILYWFCHYFLNRIEIQLKGRIWDKLLHDSYLWGRHYFHFQWFTSRWLVWLFHLAVVPRGKAEKDRQHSSGWFGFRYTYCTLRENVMEEWFHRSLCEPLWCSQCHRRVALPRLCGDPAIMARMKSQAVLCQLGSVRSLSL